MDKAAILVFGVGDLQKSLIERCKLKGLYTIGIDPSESAICKDVVDVFEVVSGKDFEKTLEVALRFQVKGLITTATDKPLVMMARVAKALNLPFYSIETAEWSTDKHLMKQKFREAYIPCAKGFLLTNLSEMNDLMLNYPVIVKPRDNSGSRGVIYCENSSEIENAVQEAFQYTHKGNVLVEEFIGGKEYSVESIHYLGTSHVIQITEKITTAFPYNVELGHIQPADVTFEQMVEIKKLIVRIAEALNLTNCASHTEIKINSKGIYVIETSPRLGGDFISSTLVPLSTGINMEDILIDISTNHPLQLDCFNARIKKSSGIKYFELPAGIISSINGIEILNNIPGIKQWHFNLKLGDRVNKITSSLKRYGYVIFQADKGDTIENLFEITDTILAHSVLIN
jgi:carbamoyl-phosphate synthase large subunit